MDKNIPNYHYYYHKIKYNFIITITFLKTIEIWKYDLKITNKKLNCLNHIDSIISILNYYQIYIFYNKIHLTINYELNST